MHDDISLFITFFFPVVPLVIVAVSGGAGYKYYINDV